MDCNLSGQDMAIKVLKKINSRLKFLYRKQDVLNASLKRLLCNALIQPHFDYARQAWYPNLTKTLSRKLQCAQNKCIRFCLDLESRAHLDNRTFKKINWLPTSERVNQRICVSAFNFFNNSSPLYMSDIFTPCKVIQNTRNSAHRFKIPFRRTNNGQNTLSYLGPKIWNSLSSDLKLSKNKNAFKHKMKHDYFTFYKVNAEITHPTSYLPQNALIREHYGNKAISALFLYPCHINNKGRFGSVCVGWFYLYFFCLCYYLFIFVLYYLVSFYIVANKTYLLT